jgi:23S rRNA pseudouridine1911/1915/1917 synthase
MNDFDPNYPPFEERVFRFVIPPKQTPARLDVYLTGALANATRSKVQEAIESGAALVNGARAKGSRKIKPGDVIECRFMKPPPLQLIPEKIPLDIVYEDEWLLVVNKPAGMVVHPGFGNRYGTLVNALLWHLGVREPVQIESARQKDEEENDDGDDEMGKDETENDETQNDDNLFGSDDGLLRSDSVRPGIVHRLDKDTSGILAIAKNASVHARLARQFADRTAKRRYYALVWGNLREDAGSIEGNIGRSPSDRKKMAVLARGGKHAVTDYVTLERFANASLLELKLRTGRTHQIRVHCAHIGHPLVGDQTYGGAGVVAAGKHGEWKRLGERLLSLIPRQALHAKTLGFTHPERGDFIEFDSELPPDFAAALEEARKSAR